MSENYESTNIKKMIQTFGDGATIVAIVIMLVLFVSYMMWISNKKMEYLVQHPSFKSALVSKLNANVRDSEGWSKDDYQLYRNALFNDDITNQYIM